MNDIKRTSGGLALLGGRLCLDFCNTVAERHAETPHDLLVRGYAAWVYWCADVGLITPETAAAYTAWHAENPDAAQALFEQVIGLREAIYALGLAAINRTPPPDAALAQMNTWAAAVYAARELVPVGENQLGWVWRDGLAPEMPAWEITLSALDVLLEEDATRLRQCPGCGWLFYDGSKNNSRTWCDMRYCGNRAKNKRFHAKQRNHSAE